MSKVSVSTIEILWSECSDLHGATFTTWAAVNAALGAVSLRDDFAKNGFRVTWQDGETYEGRIDICGTRDAADREPLSRHIRAYCGHSSGRIPLPGKRSPEEAASLIAQLGLNPAVAGHILDTYELSDGDAPAPASDVTPDPAVEQARIARQREEARLREVAKEHTVGAKYQAGRQMRDVAKDIRRELAEAARGKGPLRGVTCSVRSGRSGWTGSLTIEVLTVADGMPVLNPRRVEAEIKNPHGWTRESIPSKRGAAITAAIEVIAAAYNFNKSDLMTDYHNVGFYLDVRFAQALEATHRAEIERAVRLAAGA